MPFVVVNGLKVRYRETGTNRAGLPLVLAHGAAGSSVTWLGFMRRLGRDRHCVAPDLPGHGQTSPLPRGPHTVTIAAYRDFIGSFMDALELRRAVLVGHSMGGAVAMELALAEPARVTGLLLLGTSAKLPVSPALFDTIDNRFHALGDLMAQAAFSPETSEDLARRLARTGIQAPQAIARADFRACAQWDARDRIGQITAPTLVLTGTDDILAPAKHGRALAEGIPGARVIAYPRTGHMVHLERFREVVEAAETFLAGLG